MIVSETFFTARYAETDRMGIIHHSHYPVWYEAGRTEFIRQLGLPYSKIEEMGVLLPLLGLNCNYKLPAHYEDEIKVTTSIQKLTYTRLIFYYEVFKNNQPEVINYGETSHVFTDKALKPVNLSKYSPEVYKLLNDAINK